jgi:hypothetical protein
MIPRPGLRISSTNPPEMTAVTPVLDGRLTLAQRNAAQPGPNDPDGSAGQGAVARRPARSLICPLIAPPRPLTTC